MGDMNTVDTGSIETAVNQQALIVSQPKKLEGLLDTINLLNTVSERIGEDRSGDLGGGGGGSTGGQQGDDDAAQSQRDQAIANLPAPVAMQTKLKTHIEKEIKTVRKNIKKAEGNVVRPGSAYKLNELYARIRRLEGIMRELLEASVEVIERLYIRIFIDKQSVF